MCLLQPCVHVAASNTSATGLVLEVDLVGADAALLLCMYV